MSRALWAGGLGALAFGAFGLRLLLSDRPSAYMDEAAFILTGRTLIERQAVYARALDWTYGSYLWSLIAGSADMVGGLRLVRTIAAALGAIMVLATAAAAARLAPEGLSDGRRWAAALLAGLIMATFPTPIAVGRFGTYDALAGAAFMSGVVMLVPGHRRWRWLELLAGAGLLFVAFLAKYVVAIFFPFICLYFLASPLMSPRDSRAMVRNLMWFVLPLSGACALYFPAFQAELLTLLRFSTSYTDLRSPNPMRDYGVERPELLALVGLAALGWPRASRLGRGVALGGTAIVLAFQALTRADVDFWKHSIYVIFFLAPMGGLALEPILAALLGFRQQAAWRAPRWRPVGFALGAAVIAPTLVFLAYPGVPAALFPALGPWLDTVATPVFQALAAATSEWAILAYVVVLVLALLFAPLAELLVERRGPRWRARLAGLGAGRAGIVLQGAQALAWALVTGVVIGGALAFSLARSSRAVAFYPDLGPSLHAIREHTAEARTVLTDDSAVRYYLYPGLSTDHVTDPFASRYRGHQGMDAYRLAVTDRYYDVIVLDGGIGPLGRRIRWELGDLIARYYGRVFAQDTQHGQVEIYVPREALARTDVPAQPLGAHYNFDAGPQGWGGHPFDGELQPGLQVAVTENPRWNRHASLQFTVSESVSLVGVKQNGPVSKVRAHVYAIPGPDPGAEIRVGMMGFDEGWQWRDDLFHNVLAVERWTEITWELPEPGLYNQIGFKFQPDRVSTVYLAEVQVEP